MASTNLNVARLKDAVTEAQKRHRANHDAKVAEFDQLLQRQEDEWKEKWLVEWDKAGKEIAKAVKKNQPITTDMLPGGRGHTETFSQNPDFINQPYGRGSSLQRPSKTYRPSVELSQAEAVISLVDSETITPNGLDALGLTKSTQRYIFQVMGELMVGKKE